MRKHLYRRHVILFVVLFLSIVPAAGMAQANNFVKLREMQQRDRWLQDHLLTPKTASLPFSFLYGEQDSGDFLPVWRNRIRQEKLDAARTRHILTWKDRRTGLEVNCAAVVYSDYPVVEWTVYLTNTGKTATPILKDIQALDIQMERGGDDEFLLHGIKGDFCTADSFEPYQIPLVPDLVKNFAPPPYSGKSSDGPEGWPYFNLQIPNGGLMLAVGWPGQWAASFTRDNDDGLRIKAGQQLTNLVLQPGEQIRTPLIALVFWEGTDVIRAQNLWRRWYMAHVIPKVNGQPQGPLAQIQVGASEETLST